MIVITQDIDNNDLQELLDTYENIAKTGRSASNRVNVIGYHNNYGVGWVDIPEKYFQNNRLDILKRSIELIREKNPQVYEFELKLKDPIYLEKDSSVAFNPTFDRVVIEIDAPAGRSPGGIIIPDKAQEKSSKGVVREVGPGRWGYDSKRIPISVAVGDKVLFVRYDGTEFQTEDIPPRSMAVVSETSILGTIS